MTIGEVARRTGLPVKTVRFYSDEGLLPPAERTAAGYRLYDDRGLARLDLIRTLRDAGLGLDAIAAVLEREMSLAEALTLRLQAVEAHIASLRHVAAALRAALREGPDHAGLRRLNEVTRLSRQERRATIARFYERVSEGIAVDPAWTERMIEASVPELPDEPSAEQIDAWVELASIVSDDGFVDNMRVQAEVWNEGLDPQRSAAAGAEIFAAASEAVAAGEPPDGEVARGIAQRWMAASAAALGRAPDAEFRAGLRARLKSYDPRAARYWELVAIMSGRPATTVQSRVWRWIVEAAGRVLDD
jgi:DNA-binding transcriptional MerR regulator